MTPEGKIKKAVKKLLDAYPVYQYWPVPGGFGKGTVDVLGCINGKFFAIETKAPGKKPTKLQLKALEEVGQVGGAIFIIGTEEPPDLSILKMFLDAHDPR